MPLVWAGSVMDERNVQGLRSRAVGGTPSMTSQACGSEPALNLTNRRSAHRLVGQPQRASILPHQTNEFTMYIKLQPCSCWTTTDQCSLPNFDDLYVHPSTVMSSSFVFCPLLSRSSSRTAFTVSNVSSPPTCPDATLAFSTPTSKSP